MRIEQLTFTRFIAAISIVIFHYGRSCDLFYNKYTGFLFEQANLGVSYFFILSGFVMIVAYQAKKTINVFEFLKNRFARIYPIYFLAIFFLAVAPVVFKSFPFPGFKDLLLSIFMIQSWFPGKAMTVNSPGWSLSVELLFYAVFPFLVNLVYSKVNLKVLTVLIVAFWTFSQIIIHLLISAEQGGNVVMRITNLSYFPLAHLNEFLVGNLAGLFFIRKPKKRQNLDLQTLLACAVMILVLKFPSNLYYHNGLLALIFVPLILIISSNSGIITKVFSKKPFVFLGEISFGIYILQYPVWMVMSESTLSKFLHIDNATLAFFTRLTILILVSAISYQYYETPIRKLLKRFGQQGGSKVRAEQIVIKAM